MCALTLVFTLTALQAAPPPWPQWRGPDGTGLARATNVVLTWSATNHLRWKTALPGIGFSSPVVWDDHIFLTTAIEGEVIPGAKAPVHVLEGQEFRHPESVGADRRQTLKVLGVAARDGKLLWEQTVHDGRVYDDRHRKGSYAASTPVTDGRRVVSFFGAEGMFCHDNDGRLQWKVDLSGFSTIGLGPGSSPVRFGSLVIAQCDQKDGEGSFVQAWDFETGKSVWRTERRVSASWSSPLLVEADGRTVLVTSGSEHLIAYDPRNGRELWRLDGLHSNAVPSPIAWNHIVLFTAGYPTKRAVAVEAGSGRLLWEYGKGTAYVPSPVPWDGHFYLMTDSGMLTCLEAGTGKAVYEGERLPAPAKFTASAVAVASHILLTADDGRTFVMRAGPKPVPVAVNNLEEPMMASPAVVGGRLYLRGERHLYCVGE